MNSIFPKKFLLLVLITSIWIHISEILRFFIIVLPEMRRSLAPLPQAIPIDGIRLFIWGIWDTVLTIAIVYITWICTKHFGKTTKAALLSSVVSWTTFFLLFWIAMVNMNLSKLSLLIYTLPLTLIETTIGAWICIKLLKFYKA